MEMRRFNCVHILMIISSFCEGLPTPSAATSGLEETTHASAGTSKAPPPETACNGTDVTTFSSVSAKRRYEQYREHYSGCRLVKGDLVISKLTDPTEPYNMTFLSEIEEITGYLLIQAVLAEEIPLINLKTIRGKRLYKNFYAVYVENNFLAPSKGLRELQMPRLKSINRGDVKIGRNPNLCFMENIEWGQLMKEQMAYLDKSGKPGDLATSDKCGHCHPDCTKYCWGRGQDMCQDRSTLFLIRSDRNTRRQKGCNNVPNCKDTENLGTGPGAVPNRRPCTENNRIRCKQQKLQRKQLSGSFSSTPAVGSSTAAAVNDLPRE